MIDATSVPRRALPLALLPLAFLFIALMSAGVVLEPPRVRSDSSAAQFDASAARARLARVLGDETPHPVDSAAQDAVRDAVLREIAALGLQPEVRESFVCRPQPRGPLVDCAQVRNIIFSIGPSSGPAVLAAAHYDSVPAGPGASDDGIGLAAWLEVARVLSREQLTRRIIFLFTDGEEPGLMGASAFANDDPLMASVEALVNLDVRGTRGPAVFFETNQPNADAIAAFARAPRGIANSVAADVYRLLPNSSDVTVLTRPGLDIINIALIDGLEDYHTPLDTLASQDPRSLQHMGDIALDVTRRLASAPDRGVNASMIYADIASRGFISMPSWVGQGALALSALFAFAAFWRAGPDSRWRTLAAPLAALVVAGLLAAAFGFALSLLRPGEDYAFAYPEPARAWCALLALFGVVVSLMVLRVSRTPGRAETAAMFWFALIGFAASLFSSGLAILFVPPASAYALACLVALAWKPAQAIGGAMAAALALLIWAPTLYLFELALGFEFPFAISVLVGMMTLTWVGVIVRAQGETRWRGVAVILGAGALAGAVVSALVPNATAARPQPLNISYFLNTTDGEARIIAGTAARALPRELASAFTREFILPGDLIETWAAPTEAETIAAPALDELSVTEEGGERIVRARLRMNGAYRAILRMPLSARPLRATVSSVAVNFAETGEGPDFMNLACQGRACDGAEIVLALDAAGEQGGDWYLIGQSPGAPVPAAVEAMRARRPATATPIQNGDSVIALLRFRP